MSGVCPKCGFAVNEREVAICARTDCPGDETLKSFGYDASCRAMTMTPLEIVAKALYERAFNCNWEAEPSAERELWLAAARAAIAAIPVNRDFIIAVSLLAGTYDGGRSSENIVQALKRHILEQK